MKKTLLILFLSSIFIAGFCFAPLENDSLIGLAAERELEIEYPALPGVEAPTTVKTAMPDFIRYFFTFSIIIAGILAFGAIVLGGIRYVTSAGAAAAMSDAKDQITSGFLGVIIILASFLILNTINPQLIIPENPLLDPTKTGIRIYSNTNNCGEAAIDDTKEINSMKVFQNLPQLKQEGEKEMAGAIILDWGTDGEYKIESIEFLTSSKNLAVKIYEDVESQGNFRCFGEATACAGAVSQSDFNEDECKDFPSGVIHKSIELDWRIPGVYLYAQADCSDDPKIYTDSSDTLPDFNDRVKAIKLIGGDYDSSLGRYQLRYGVVLHEHEDQLGRAAIFDFDTVDHDQCYPISNIAGDTNQVNLVPIGVSSITVYQEPRYKEDGTEQIIGGGVRFWGDKNYKKESQDYVLPSPPSYLGEGYFPDLGDAEDKMTSMEMDGHYIVLLFEDEYYKGRCQVEIVSNPDFRKWPIGQCGWLGRSDCLSSFIVKARK